VAFGAEEGDACAGCLGFLVGQHLACGIKPHVFDVLNVAAAAGEEDVEHGQRAGELGGLQILLHVSGDEEAEAERGVERVAQIAQGGAELALAEPGHIRKLAHGLDGGEHVGGGVREEGVRMQKIRTAEDIEQRRGVADGLRQVQGRPFADRTELAFLGVRPGGVEFLGMRVELAPPGESARGEPSCGSPARKRA
jgi:hypothetical protein